VVQDEINVQPCSYLSPRSILEYMLHLAANVANSTDSSKLNTIPHLGPLHHRKMASSNDSGVVACRNHSQLPLQESTYKIKVAKLGPMYAPLLRRIACLRTGYAHWSGKALLAL